MYCDIMSSYADTAQVQLMWAPACNNSAIVSAVSFSGEAIVQVIPLSVYEINIVASLKVIVVGLTHGHEANEQSLL